MRSLSKLINESHEFRDISEDLQKVKRMKEQVEYSKLVLLNVSERQLMLQRARILNGEMRQKYPGIDEMLRLANALPRIPVQRGAGNGVFECEEFVLLNQDYYGILWHVLVKKRITRRIEDFVKQIEDN